MKNPAIFTAITLYYCILLDIASSYKVYDLSHELNNDTIVWPNRNTFQLFIKHRGLIYPKLDGNSTGLINPKLVENDNDNYWYERNEFSTPEHIGTHLDAPVHFARNQWTVDQIPPERLFGPVSVVDLRSRVKDNPNYQISTGDLIEWESVKGKQLERLIILWTGWGNHWPDRDLYYYGTSNITDDSLLRFPGLSQNAAKWLVTYRGIHGIGIDTASIDYGKSKGFYTHRAFGKANVYIIENLNTKVLDENVKDEPLFLMVNPLKITTGSGSPVRPILLSGVKLTDVSNTTNQLTKNDEL